MSEENKINENEPSTTSTEIIKSIYVNKKDVDNLIMDLALIEKIFENIKPDITTFSEAYTMNKQLLLKHLKGDKNATKEQKNH